MKSKLKVMAMALVIAVTMQLQACSLFKTQKLTTPGGVELSTQLVEVVDLLHRAKGVYLTIGTIVGAAHDADVITDEQWTKVATVASKFQMNLHKVTAIMLSWYDAEDAGLLTHREQLKQDAVDLLITNLKNILAAVEEIPTIAASDKDIIRASVEMLELVYGVGGTK